LGAEPAAPARDWPARLAPRADLLERLNTWWRIGGPDAGGRSLKGRAAHRVRLLLATVLGPQETFNAAVVQYINEFHQAAAEAIERCDTMVDAALREREAVAARGRRLEAAMDAMRVTHEELRQSVGVLQQATQMLRQQGAQSTVAGLQSTVDVERDRRPQTEDRRPPDALGYKYLGFEDQFRGSPEAIRQRLTGYVPIFAGASDVLDVGCGRGEFLALLREHGVTARGIDTNESMVQVCREKGLAAESADALTFLRAQPPGSLGGLFAAQVVEHLEPQYLAALLDAAFHALRPGAAIVLETINPACWFAFFESYIRDITHVRPLHPDTLRFLLLATGFQRLEIRYSAAYPDHEKLQPIPPTAALADSVETLNANVEKINRLLFTFLDYAAIGQRP
jgi:SAM-dependent methyltransferase